MTRQSDLYRENAENCMQMAEAAQSEPAYNRYKRMEGARGSPWLRNKTGLMANDRRSIQRRPNRGPAASAVPPPPQSFPRLTSGGRLPSSG